jgi:TolB-like protein
VKKFLVILAVFVLLVGKINAQQLNLDTVIERSARAVEEALPRGAKVAVLNFVSTSETFSDHVIEELTGKLVNGKKITIVDRRNLALISQEMNLQLSGDVSDESAQAIGRMLGAQSIVSGTLTNMGTFYRFRVRVINVETAAIQSQISLDLRSDEQVVFLLSGNPSDKVAVRPSSQTTPQTNISPTVTTTPSAKPITFLEVVPSYDRDGASVGDATLAGTQYRNALVLTTTSGGYSLHNLNRRYARFTGEIGRVDGTNSRDATVHFYGDDKLLRTFNLKANDLPAEFNLAVEGIRQLRIEFGGSGSQYSYNTRYALIDAFLIPSATPTPVTFNPPTSSVSLLGTAPSYDNSGASVGNASLAGIQYRDILLLTTTSGGYSLHNLNRRYARFTCNIGRVDGTNSRDSTISFFGDGTLLRTFNLKANDLPLDINLEVEGIRQLRIEFGGSGSQYSYNTRYALVNTILIP